MKTFVVLSMGPGEVDWVGGDEEPKTEAEALRLVKFLEDRGHQVLMLRHLPMGVEDHSTDNGDGWVLWRCPQCNAWDYSLQGTPDMWLSGVHTCTECGQEFEIPKRPDGDEGK